MSQWPVLGAIGMGVCAVCALSLVTSIVDELRRWRTGGGGRRKRKRGAWRR